MSGEFMGFLSFVPLYRPKCQPPRCWHLDGWHFWRSGGVVRRMNVDPVWDGWACVSRGYTTGRV